MILPQAARQAARRRPAARRPQCAVKWDRNLKPKLAIMRQCTSVRDRRTDRQTDRHCCLFHRESTEKSIQLFKRAGRVPTFSNLLRLSVPSLPTSSLLSHRYDIDEILRYQHDINISIKKENIVLYKLYPHSAMNSFYAAENRKLPSMEDRQHTGRVRMPRPLTLYCGHAYCHRALRFPRSQPAVTRLSIKTQHAAVYTYIELDNNLDYDLGFQFNAIDLRL